MEYTKQELLDKFAAAALTALIAKMPIFDRKGEFGVSLPIEEMQDIKKDLASSAYEYACWMMIAREASKEWLEINNTLTK